MPNAELLRATLDLIETFPERWNQEWWTIDLEKDGPVGACGTAYCFGGWVLTLSNIPMRGDGGCVNLADIPAEARGLIPERGIWRDNFGLGEPTTVETGYAAAAVLGLHRKQAVNLFAPDNSLDDLRRIVAELCTEPEAAVS